MINIRTIRKLEEDDGLTLKNGKKIQYKSGYQVAYIGYEVSTPEAAIAMVKMLDGNCGIWHSKGVYYIDKSRRISTKKKALDFGRQHGQISIFKWADMSLIYC